MYTVNGLDNEYINDIYKNIILYSIKKYENLPLPIQSFYEQKYQNAINLKRTLNIDDNKNIEEIKNYLNNQKEIIDKIKEENQIIIDLLVPKIIHMLAKNINENMTITEVCEYLFDYITLTMEYSTEWYQYCKEVPPVDGFEFSFYKGIPLSNSYPGFLVTKKGICDDIANLFVYLGKVFNLPIKKETCEHNENLHSINYLEINGMRSYFDATSVILKNKKKNEAFLISREILNKENDYVFYDQQESITLEKKNIIMIFFQQLKK